MFAEYSLSSRTEIPVTNCVDETSLADSFADPIECYYSSLDDLVEILDVAHLHDHLIRRLRYFLEDNMSVFSRSELI